MAFAYTTPGDDTSMLKEQILTAAEELAPEMTQHRRWLHNHAECGFELKETVSYVKKALESMGYKVQCCGKAGLVVTIGQGEKTLLLRGDMDALPVLEESGETFASTNGKMHACGHDMHTAMLLGTAKLLKSYERTLNGVVKLMFQPAEEIFEGAKDMIRNGILEDPKVDAAMMIHVATAMPIPAGTVLVSAPGITAPAADYFTIRIQGKGCHGSSPHHGVDALTAAAHVLIALQEIQARELAADEEAVLTVGTFHGGTAENVIADTASLGGTIRTYNEETRAYLKERIAQIASSVASAFRASALVEFGSGCPTLVNDGKLCEEVAGYLKELLGPAGALTAEELNPGGKNRGGGSEDFAYVSQEVPSLMLALAAGEPEKGYSYPQHHPKVRFDEKVLPIGAATFAYTALRYLGERDDFEDFTFNMFRNQTK